MLKGEIVDAEYRDTGVSVYAGNPYIEALPAIRSREEALAAFQCLPPVPKVTRPELLPHALKAFNLLQVVLPAHLSIERRLSTCVRAGYLHRNPMRKGYALTVADAADQIAEDRMPSHTMHKETGFSITGPSGSGKSTAIETALLQLPQVIRHQKFGTQEQLVWLKIECPHDGSIRGLVREFFRAVDLALETEYEDTYMRPRALIDELAADMANIAGQQGLGVLVVDEVQNLSEVKTGGNRNLLRFFVQLQNILGLPVVLVGTPQVHRLLSKEFRMLRRFSSEGNVLVDRMKDPATWDMFIKQIWDYQLLAKRVPESAMTELSNALFDASQGILAVAIRAYCFAQVVARDRGLQELNPDLFQVAIEETMPYLVTPLAALRSGLEGAEDGLDDLKLPDVAATLDAQQQVVSVDDLKTLLDQQKREPSTAPAKDAKDKARSDAKPGVGDLEALGVLRQGDEFK